MTPTSSIRRYGGVALAIMFLGYGLVRIGVGVALLTQSLALIDVPDLAEAVSEVSEFLTARESKQIVPFSVPGYFVYIAAMGFLLTLGGVGALVRRQWAYVSLGLYLGMHAALFINYQEINPKLVGFAISVALVVLLFYLRPPTDHISPAASGAGA